jgi:hypothetical protein
MARINSIGIHGCSALKAEARRSDGCAWLMLQFGDTPAEHVALFMDYDRAGILAAAINNGEAEWVDFLANEREAEERMTHRGQSYADEHRLRVSDVL